MGTTPTTRMGRVQLQNLCDAHKRLAHADIRKVGFVLGIRLRESLTKEMLCAHCACAKIISARKGTPRDPPTKILQTVYIDAVGPFTPSYGDGYRFMHTVHEKFSEYTTTEFSVDRAEGGPITTEWIDKANNRHHPHKVVDLISDGAPEYATSIAFKDSVKERGINHIVNAPYAHHESANVERPQRTVQDLARASRIGAGLPPTFWSFACIHATQVKSVLPTSKRMKEAVENKDDRPITPYEIWNSTRATSYADLHSSIHSFGAQCVVYHPPEGRESKKNSDHGELAVYLCKALPHMGHKCLILRTGKVKVYRTVEVHETIFQRKCHMHCSSLLRTNFKSRQTNSRRTTNSRSNTYSIRELTSSTRRSSPPYHWRQRPLSMYHQLPTQRSNKVGSPPNYRT